MVTSVGSSNYSATSAYTTRTRPDPAELASKLFSKLDTKGQGYIQESDLESAFSQVYASSSSSSSSATTTASSSSASSQASSDATQLFSALDSDGNGQVTESEFSSGLQKLADALDSQAFSSRMQGAGGMPPPRGHGDGDGDDQNDTGFTKDQLTSQLQDIGSTDSKRSGVISDIVNNFDKADSDGDGKVTRQEAMAYEQSKSTASSTSASSTATSSTDSASSVTSSSATSHHDARMMHRLMELMRSYGSNSGTTSDGSSSSIAVTA